MLAAGLVLTAGIVGAAPIDPQRAVPVEHHVFHGTVGPYPVGALLDVANRVAFSGGSYYFASDLRDIPVDGALNGSELTLKGPDGGVFDLHFTANGKSSANLTFYTSTGLVGTWTKGGTTYPVRLDGDFSVSGEPGHEYAGVTAASDAAFEAMVRRFVAGVVAGDRAATAAATHFPLRINGQKPFEVATASDLKAQWSRIFTPDYVARIGTAIPHHLFTHDGQAMIGDGDAWFDDRGAVAINPRPAR